MDDQWSWCRFILSVWWGWWGWWGSPCLMSWKGGRSWCSSPPWSQVWSGRRGSRRWRRGAGPLLSAASPIDVLLALNWRGQAPLLNPEGYGVLLSVAGRGQVRPGHSRWSHCALPWKLISASQGWTQYNWETVKNIWRLSRIFNMNYPQKQGNTWPCGNYEPAFWPILKVHNLIWVCRWKSKHFTFLSI